MIRSNKSVFYWTIWLTIFIFSSFFYIAFASIDQWTLSFSVIWIWIRHGTPNNINLWTPISSLSNQEISGQFTDNFWVEDLQWYVTGHYTTIQCDGVYGSAGNKLTWVYLKAGNTAPVLIQWLTGNVFISTALTNYTNIITPVTYIYKPTNLTNIWIVNKYWDKPWLKIMIPGWTPPGTYSGTIVFSLYMY